MTPHEKQAQIKAQILGSYNVPATTIKKSEEEVSLEKNKDMEQEIEKGGEGSRGGEVIGHTSTGKPIYANSSHESHKSFTSSEHKDAQKLHSDLAKKAKKENNQQGNFDHSSHAQNHEWMAKKK